MDQPAVRPSTVLASDASFEEGARHEHAVPVDVTGGEDVETLVQRKSSTTT
jgi:hypothetical protein